MQTRAVSSSILFLTSALMSVGAACSSEPGDSVAMGESAEAVTACPASSPSDDVMRAAATIAFDLMRDTIKVGPPAAPTYSNTVLASQRYRVRSSGTGIEFEPADPLYKYVSDTMKAHLDFGQSDATVAKFLSDGLKSAFASSNGKYFPSISGIGALANFSYPGPSAKVRLVDPTSYNNSHYAYARGSAWCGTSKVTITETVQQSYSFSPLLSLQTTNPLVGVSGSWLSSPPASFKGTSNKPTTPFNGPSSSGNPYLVISVNGSTVNWATYNFAGVSCYTASNPNFTCSGSIEIDPIPYAEPAAYYNSTGLVGTQANPFPLDSVSLYADAKHQGQWATRTVNGAQERGTFSLAVTKLGVTLYRYVKK